MLYMTTPQGGRPIILGIFWRLGGLFGVCLYTPRDGNCPFPRCFEIFQSMSVDVRNDIALALGVYVQIAPPMALYRIYVRSYCR